MSLTEERRREVFKALVEIQDAGEPVVRSRRLTAERFSLTETDVKAIEREGLDAEWPPL
jgi:hypothetical protein